ncbi:carbohydrate ABC transporter permease [Streptomyces sp. NPDC056255]|uniref:carbohydrate ABC transporter permease n=1 Tax=Streptomyces sp. NPDC056255 TaxID=3345764 RepID=UPI0035DAA126
MGGNATVTAFPLCWMVLSALKPAGEIQSTDPRPWTLSPSLDSFLMRDFGQLNTLGSLILPHLAFSLPFAIWMLRGFVKAVPETLEEAAYIDGASRTRFLWQILFPLVFPGLVATSVFSFISTWNDFLFAKSFIISDTSQSTLPMALLVFFKPDENDWGGIMAASTVMTVPVLVFFVLVQRRLVSGLGGAVKD